MGFFICVVSVLSAAPPLAAQVAQTGDYLARMDSDRDGRVSLDEYLVWMGYAFTQMDRNGDDVLQMEELPAGRGRSVTRTEHRQRLAERFALQDANRDGYLDAKELSAPPR
ncbi:EF-hand domain-containing protein [Luteimonas sp. RIT-PG2_3]